VILLTGAAGKTGKAILNTLIPHGIKVRSLVRNVNQSDEVKKIGSTESVVGDLRDSSALERAVQGVRKIYFISPNMTSDELEIGKNLVHHAKNAGVERFVYHSVFHPQVEDMPHHWQKMRMEEFLFKSGIDFTILQPCAYMQNVLANWKTITERGVYGVPYATSARISIIDLADVATAAEVVLTQLNHSRAAYELAGPEALSQDEVAGIISAELGKDVRAAALDRAQWAADARNAKLDEQAIQTLLKMFEYYEKYGLSGNPNVLSFLIKRAPRKFNEFIRQTIAFEQRPKTNGNNRIDN
jgi:uncharacterized protein YbjT (DUF2867 family)